MPAPNPAAAASAINVSPAGRVSNIGKRCMVGWISEYTPRTANESPSDSSTWDDGSTTSHSAVVSSITFDSDSLNGTLAAALANPDHDGVA